MVAVKELNPKALRTHILRFLGPRTTLYRAFWLFLNPAGKLSCNDKFLICNPELELLVRVTQLRTAKAGNPRGTVGLAAACSE